MIPCNQALVRTIRALDRTNRLPEGADSWSLLVTAQEHRPTGGPGSPCARHDGPWPCRAYQYAADVVADPWAALMAEGRARRAASGRREERP